VSSSLLSSQSGLLLDTAEGGAVLPIVPGLPVATLLHHDNVHSPTAAAADPIAAVLAELLADENEAFSAVEVRVEFVGKGGAVEGSRPATRPVGSQTRSSTTQPATLFGDHSTPRSTSNSPSRTLTPPLHTHTHTIRPQKQRSATSTSSPVLSGAERANLINWMASAATQLGLGDDTLFTAVACLDELRLSPDTPHALIYAAACLWLAAKWAHGARAPPASLVVAALPACGCGECLGCNAASAAAATAVARRRLLRAEGEVLAALNYGARVLRRPTIDTFLRAALLRIQQQHQEQPHHCRHAWLSPALLGSTASLLAEQALLESQLLNFRPSVVTAACIAYAAVLLGAPLRNDELAAATGADGSAISAAVGLLRAVHAAVTAAAAAGNPYAASLRWVQRAPAAVRVAPIDSAADARLAPLAAVTCGTHCAAQHGHAASSWVWVLPAAVAVA